MKKKILVLISVMLAFSFLVLPQSSEAAAKKKVYDYQLINQADAIINVNPGEIHGVWIEVKNTGTATWFNSGANPVRLGTGSVYGDYDQQKDNNSRFSTADWYSGNRAAHSLYPEVRPGWNTRFQFDIKAPLSVGTYRAYFTPLVEGVEWMKDIGIYWQINVTRAKPYSFNYEDPTDPINTEVNKNTSTVLSADQQLAFDAMVNNFDYTSFSGSSSFSLDFKFSSSLLSESKSSIDETSKNIIDMKIPFDLSSQAKNEVILNVNTDNTGIKNGNSSKEYLKTAISLNTKSDAGQITKIFDGEAEAVLVNQSDAYLKINKFNLLDTYFTYSKPDTWYGSQSSMDQDQLDVYDNSRSEAINYLTNYKNAIARDLNRGGILISNKGTEMVGGSNTTHLQILINADNAKKYYDILNERSTTDQSIVDSDKAFIDQYLDSLYIDTWIDPATKMTKKISFLFSCKKNDSFDKLSVSMTYMFNKINDPSLVVSVPTSFEPMENLDLMQKLQDKLSPTEIMKARISSVGNELAYKVHNALDKAKDFIKNIGK